MQEVGLPFLAGWQNFYIIIGTAAATLTGLMFVVITLITGIESRVSTLNAGISSFTTPTVVHFGVVLILAGILSAPWQTYVQLGLVLGLVGLWAVIYLVVVIRRMWHIPDYQTPLKDWLWYSVFPLSAYIVLIFAAILLQIYPSLALYLIGLVMVVLLSLSIHNAWDLVVYLAVDRSHPDDRNPRDH